MDPVRNNVSGETVNFVAHEGVRFADSTDYGSADRPNIWVAKQHYKNALYYSLPSDMNDDFRNTSPDNTQSSSHG